MSATPHVSLPAISLFSGVGGLDTGIHQAGFQVHVAVESDADSAASLRANLPGIQPEDVIERSILEVDTEELLAVAGLAVGEAALVVGGPPCTPFSKSGYWLEYKRKGLDPDASLLEQFARVVEEARPATALMENVYSLVYRNHNAVPFQRLLTRLRAAGYTVAWEVLNAADFGVPQLRKRLFLYAVRDGSPPAFPRPTHSGWTETSRRIDHSLLPYRTSREAIGDLEGRDDLAEPEEVVGGRYRDLLPLSPTGRQLPLLHREAGAPEAGVRVAHTLLDLPAEARPRQARDHDPEPAWPVRRPLPLEGPPAETRVRSSGSRPSPMVT